MPDDTSTAERWAYFRHAVIGTLLIAPPEPGQLRAALLELSRKSFSHPVTGMATRVGFSTLEKWYYAARSGDDPCAQLRRKVRKDAGQQRAISDLLMAAMQAQYSAHPTWSYALHYKNVDALVAADASLGPLPSYPTLRRALKARGLARQRRTTDHKAEMGPREVRSFEMPHAHALWHLDFHHGKRNVMRPDGSLVVPKLLAVLDDHSRVCCHAQWYVEEGTEQLVHALLQAFLKRGLPRAIMMDNGSAMIAAETQAGLKRLGISQRFTEAESPYQNGKQETFFAPVEGQLIAMLEGVEVLDLELLNRATQAWVEGDYHRSKHRELGMPPRDDYYKPRASADLRQAWSIFLMRFGCSNAANNAVAMGLAPLKVLASRSQLTTGTSRRFMCAMHGSTSLACPWSTRAAVLSCVDCARSTRNTMLTGAARSCTR